MKNSLRICMTRWNNHIILTSYNLGSVPKRLWKLPTDMATGFPWKLSSLSVLNITPFFTVVSSYISINIISTLCSLCRLKCSTSYGQKRTPINYMLNQQWQKEDPVTNYTLHPMDQSLNSHTWEVTQKLPNGQ